MTIEIMGAVIQFYRAGTTRYGRAFVHANLSIPQAVCILADETAEWKIAGLRQLDRLALALNDFFGRAHVAAPIPIFFLGTQAAAPRDSRLRKIRFFSATDALAAEHVLVLSTHLVLGRNALGHEFPSLTVNGAEISDPALPGRLHALEEEFVARAETERDWSYLAQRSDIAHCERQLFRSTGKSQDGFVSRFVNRPLSRTLSRLLARFPVSPNQWTLLLMAVPIAGACFIIRGDYLGFAIGALFFQLHSALDGCDGEIARAKYQETTAGSKLDEVCDRLSTLLFAVSLGFGLTRQFGNADGHWLYFAEGLSAAILIGVTETLMTRNKIEHDAENKGDAFSDFVSEQRQSFNQGDHLKLWIIRHSGMLSLGESATAFFGQLTKRDVFNFVFMLLAVCGLAHWVLHILAFCACLIVIFALKDLFTPTLDANSAA